MSELTQDNPNHPTLDQVWQDHWPSVAYEIGYKHEQNVQLDPAVMQALLSDVGVPETEIPALTIFVTNRSLLATGGYTNEPAKAKHLVKKLAGEGFEGKHIMVLADSKNDQKHVGTALHEGKHFADALEGKFSINTYRARIVLGGVLGLGIAATSSLVNILATDATFPKTGFDTVGQTAYDVIMGLTGVAYAYQYSPEERRARKVASNNDLLTKYTPHLFTKPQK